MAAAIRAVVIDEKYLFSKKVSSKTAQWQQWPWNTLASGFFSFFIRPSLAVIEHSGLLPPPFVIQQS